MNSDAAKKSLLWPLLPLLFMVGGMTFMLYVAVPLPDSKLIGGFLLLIGVLNAPFSRILGRFYSRTSARPFVGWFWNQCGEKGAQLFFLGIAVILALAGGILVIFGSV